MCICKHIYIMGQNVASINFVVRIESVRTAKFPQVQLLPSQLPTCDWVGHPKPVHEAL